MYIRRTTIKSRRTGEPYDTYRLVKSMRTPDGVRQHTLLNLARHFDVPRERWAALAQRIEQLTSPQETLAQRYAAQVIQARSRDEPAQDQTDFQTVDIANVDLVRPRSVGVEHVTLATIR